MDRSVKRQILLGSGFLLVPMLATAIKLAEGSFNASDLALQIPVVAIGAYNIGYGVRHLLRGEQLEGSIGG
ncbi:MAG: hypothetical protein ACP5UH_03335 [Candidatus Micrarchaeia archaeon]